MICLSRQQARAEGRLAPTPAKSGILSTRNQRHWPGFVEANVLSREFGMAATSRTLFRSPLITLSDFTCDTPKSGCGCERCDSLSSITLIRRGVHAHHARNRVALAEPGVALLYRGGEPYRLSHPYERAKPDRSTCVEFDGALLEEAFGSRAREQDLGAPVSAETQLLNHRIIASLDRGVHDDLAAEEAALGLVDAVARDFTAAIAETVSASGRRSVERARAFIASRPERTSSLQDVAGAAGSSPFHLARLFKQHSGMTLRGYRMRLRLALVLQELADGADELAALARRTGFSHHSHMTSSFQKSFGMTPRAFREAIRGARLAKKSKFLKAAFTPPT